MHYAKRLVSEEDFLSLSESNLPVELVDGDIVRAPSPSYWHQKVVGRLFLQLNEWAKAQSISPTFVTAPLDIRFGPQRILQPDLAIYLNPLAADEAVPISRVPDICVECTSTNRTYDRVTKRYIYGEAGVHEYWVLDPACVVERYSGEALRQFDEFHDSFVSLALRNFTFDVQALLAG